VCYCTGRKEENDGMMMMKMMSREEEDLIGGEVERIGCNNYYN
jgi:hypothetical protein